MAEHRARSLTTRALLAALLALTGLVAPLAGTAAAHPAPSTGVAAQLRADLDAYLQERGAAEHVSAAGVSVSLPGRRSTIDVTTGTTTFGGSVPVRADAVWQIGSNTKAFTAVLVLQLEAQHRLSIDDTLGQWLPQYPQWRDVTIRRLLSMTSGIPTYDDQPAWYADYAADPHRSFSPEQLVGYVVDAPATSGYSYSNTNYVLAEMIIERAAGRSYAEQLYRRIIEPLGLRDLHYRPDVYPAWVTDREPAGYLFNPDFPLPGLLGQDVSRDTLSWARSAGAIISTTSDMTRWERALYSGRLLPPQQQAELESLVSTTTGQPIASTSATDPQGFGLGIAQLSTPQLGTFWFYEGQTLGFRAVHAFFPESGLIIAFALNSSVEGSNDQIGPLMQTLYETVEAAGLIPGA
ncbi:(Serine-type) D-alanyl-D-alanine carboxypeptidase [Modestobacter italicus]|uniref:(Serine-type) D-alanyl-D-alanine carboxypeptidase n=1 Tax=Modestobacter italicus (strain DSM 44449 / CECT 9708 / BC 501) TaxID=2732864 RepID=I4F1Q7_MODI5|nr:serine hydrolase domain-containing protein [Modestobacter marinus]CCH89570.1 (Serine-type) D-alanyl-D-alanine carboxypeptidase [Modestobacter marinus]